MRNLCIFKTNGDPHIALQPLMLIVPDIDDVYTPLHMDIIVQLTEVSCLCPFVKITKM